MKKICLFIIIFSGYFFAQEVDIKTYSDTTKFEIKPNCFSPNEIRYELIDVTKYANYDMAILKMHTTLINNIGYDEDKSNFTHESNMLKPLYVQYLQDQKYGMWKTILGSVQLGAVGYLAYKHIKKYGFK